MQNVIGLMRHLIGNDAGVNIQVAEEIEAMTGRSLVPQIEGKSSEANTRQQISKRISEIAAGGKPIPHWFETAAREWCVLEVMSRIAGKNVELKVDASAINLTRAPAARVLAEDLVGLVLHHAAIREEKKVAACLRLIEKLND
ncbi:hypothetical protein [Thiobacillus denitrificans]|uniref:hypothetical protein n=1 Tax=Thiobacillus denitrificans TaxID=36861 RepID=UPI00035FD4E1|nr:hypothetical protein [Thiobacillus denitrificans]